MQNKKHTAEEVVEIYRKDLEKRGKYLLEQSKNCADILKPFINMLKRENIGVEELGNLDGDEMLALYLAIKHNSNSNPQDVAKCVQTIFNFIRFTERYFKQDDNLTVHEEPAPYGSETDSLRGNDYGYRNINPYRAVY